MPLWLLLLPGGFIIWLLSQRSAEERFKQQGLQPGLRPQRGQRFDSERWFSRPGMSPAPVRSLTSADYLRHLNEACAGARILDRVKPLALRGDVAALMQTPSEVAHALALMSQPIPTLFVQKDLNVLGAEPSLPEDGVAGRATIEAVRNFQTRFKLGASWPVGPETAVAIRYAVGCIYSQDKATAHLAGGDVFAGPASMLESAPHAGGYS